MKPINTVIDRGLGGPICGECSKVLPVTGEHRHMCLSCHPHLQFHPLLDERELEVLRDTMKAKDTSARATVKRWMRLGQMADLFMGQGYEMVFRNGDEELDPFDRGGPKWHLLLPVEPNCANALCHVENGETVHHLMCPDRGPGWA